MNVVAQRIWTKYARRLDRLKRIPQVLHLVWQCSPVYMTLICAMTLVQGVVPAAQVYITKLVVDTLSEVALDRASINWGHLSYLVGIWMGMSVFELIFGQVGGVLQKIFGDRFRLFMSQRILEKAITLDYGLYEDPAYYDKLQRAQRDSGTKPLNMLNHAISLGRSVVVGSSMSALILVFDWKLMIAILIVAAPATYVQVLFARKRYTMIRERAPKLRITGYLSWLLTANSSAKEIRLFGIGPYLLERYTHLQHRMNQENRGLVIQSSKVRFGAELLSQLSMFGIMGYVMYALVDKKATFGSAAMYYQAFKKLRGELRNILNTLSQVYEDSLYLDDLFEFMQEPSRVVVMPYLKTSYSDHRPGIVFENVSFQYTPNMPFVLKDVNLCVMPGETVAIVGRNGAGKTTLIKLLARLYDPTEGRILIGGEDIRVLAPEEHMKRFGIIFQDFMRYNLTIQENIGFGNMAYLQDEKRIARAAWQSGAAPFIEQMPERYQTILGKMFDEGQELSGGQWQKLGLARAFISDAPILVLDEPTASLDVETEQDVFEKFAQLMVGRTTFLISHRFSTVRMADRILVLDGGHIIEQGTHDYLLAQNGTYSHLFHVQAKWYQY